MPCQTRPSRRCFDPGRSRDPPGGAAPDQPALRRRPFAASMVEEHRYGSNLTFAMWVKILAKIEELQAAEKPATKDTEA